MPTPDDSFGGVRTTVLLQHAAIRERLRALDAGIAIPASPLAAAYVRLSVQRLAAVFDAHLAFEEQELAPRMRVLGAWRPEREALMLSEHADRRQRLHAMCAAVDAEPSDAARVVAREAAQLAASLLECLEREEEDLEELVRELDPADAATR